MKRKKADRLVLILFSCLLILGSVSVALQFQGVSEQRPEEITETMVSTAPLARKISRKKVEEINLSLKEALYYTQLEKGAVQCNLCPKLCLLRPGERGNCKVRVNYDGVLYTLVYGRIVALHNDPIEKKPLMHFLPGARALSLATAGCNLGCVFCQNWTISQSYPEDARFLALTPQAIVDIARREGSRCIAYTYTEPTIFYEFMLDCARIAHEYGIKNVWVTAGYINREPLLELAKYMDAANVDLKGIRDEYYQKYCDGHVKPVLETLKTLHELGVHLEITNLIVPEGNDSEEDIRDLVRWVRENIGPDAVLHFSRYFPAYRMESPPPTPLATLLKARDIALKEGLHYVYIGNIPGEGFEDTYCKHCGKLLVKRAGYTILWDYYKIKEGRCPYCSEKIYGVWE